MTKKKAKLVCAYFQHGLCFRKDECAFAHDEAAVPEKTRVAIDLRNFIARRGSCVSAGCIGEFYKQFPNAKSVIGAGKIKEFCCAHPYLLAFQSDTPEGTIQSVPVGKGAQALKAAGKAKVQAVSEGQPSGSHSNVSQPSATDPGVKVAGLLSKFVALHGGRMHAGSGVGAFYKEHPEAKGRVGSLQQFCKKYPQLLRYEADGGSGHLVAVNSAPKSRSSGSGDGAPVGSVVGQDVVDKAKKAEEKERVALMWKEHLDAGRRHLMGEEREVMKAEFESFLACHDLGKVNFCSIMFTLRQLGFEEHGRWRIAAPPPSAAAAGKAPQHSNTAARGSSSSSSSSSSGGAGGRSASGDNIARVLRRFVLENGGDMHAGSCLAHFYKEHPDAKSVIGKLPKFCSDHSDLLQFKADATGGRLLVASSAATHVDQERGTAGESLRSTSPCGRGTQGQAHLLEDNCRVALLWKDHLDAGRQHLIGEERGVMKAEFDAFRASHNLPKVGFGMVMYTLQKLGFERHGTWRREVETAPAAGRWRRLADVPLEGGAATEDPWRVGKDPWSIAVRSKEGAPQPRTSAPMQWLSRTGNEASPPSPKGSSTTPSTAELAGPKSSPTMPSTAEPASDEPPSPRGSVAEIRSSLRQMTETLEASLDRLEAWEQRLDSKEKTAKRMLREVSQERRQRGRELQEAARYMATAAAAAARFAEGISEEPEREASVSAEQTEDVSRWEAREHPPTIAINCTKQLHEV